MDRWGNELSSSSSETAEAAAGHQRIKLTFTQPFRLLLKYMFGLEAQLMLAFPSLTTVPVHVNLERLGRTFSWLSHPSLSLSTISEQLLHRRALARSSVLARR